ncbi:nitroreductase family protein [Candidatus Margulisiibacteriota bacterium]
MPDFILSRRSIRKYKPDQIPKDKLNHILKAAMAAPSARNEQPWHFIIIDDKQIFEKLIEVHPSSAMLREAPVAILVCYDERLDKSNGYLIQDSAAATQNILIAANTFGIGSCWIGIYPRDKRIKLLKEELKLPPEVYPFSMIALGFPNEEKEPVDRFDQKKIHKNKWES